MADKHLKCPIKTSGERIKLENGGQTPPLRIESELSTMNMAMK